MLTRIQRSIQVQTWCTYRTDSLINLLIMIMYAVNTGPSPAPTLALTNAADSDDRWYRISQGF